MEYILSIGTNMGNRQDNIDSCVKAMGLLPGTRVLAQSPVYETQPIGFAHQQSFYNIAVKVQSDFEPNEMLGACLGIEAGFGRIRQFKNGPRIIDVDLIFAQDLRINTKNLTLPHPRWQERRFVLQPILDLFPTGNAYGFDIKGSLDKIDGQGIKAIGSVK